MHCFAVEKHEYFTIKVISFPDMVKDIIELNDLSFRVLNNQTQKPMRIAVQINDCIITPMTRSNMSQFEDAVSVGLGIVYKLVFEQLTDFNTVDSKPLFSPAAFSKDKEPVVMSKEDWIREQSMSFWQVLQHSHLRSTISFGSIHDPEEFAISFNLPRHVNFHASLKQYETSHGSVEMLGKTLYFRFAKPKSVLGRMITHEALANAYREHTKNQYAHLATLGIPDDQLPWNATLKFF